jgi:hypothetical protein
VLNAYILIQSDMGGTAVVAESVRAMPGVLETEIVMGCYDVVARTQAHDMDELATRITPQIQALRGVMRTVTCIIVQPSFYFHDREAAGRHGRSDGARRIANGAHSSHSTGSANGPISQLFSKPLPTGEMAGGR